MPDASGRFRGMAVPASAKWPPEKTAKTYTPPEHKGATPSSRPARKG